MAKAYIGMGGNLPSAAGPPEATLAAAADCLRTLGTLLGRSSLYSTEPVGFADQPRFVNAVVALETDLDSNQLLDVLLAIEQQFGRDRATGIANGPRTLDLDLLLFDDVSTHQPGLILPHPRLAQRAFVLIPLGEIAHQIGDAQIQSSVAQWLHSLQLHAGGAGDAVVPMESKIWRAGAAVHLNGSDRDAPRPGTA